LNWTLDQKGGIWVGAFSAMIIVMASIEFAKHGFTAPAWLVGGWDSVYGIVIITYGGTKAYRMVKTAKTTIDAPPPKE
jgi:hypothetical protein